MTLHSIRHWIAAASVAVSLATLSGCRSEPPRVINTPPADTRVDFSDPLLNSRKILLFGSIDERSAERLIQKLMYLDDKANTPIDLYLQTPGGDIKSAIAIERVMRVSRSPINTHALSECNSGGVMLLAAGTGKRTAFQSCLIMLHGLVVTGTPPKNAVEIVQGDYTRFWQSKTKLPADWLPIPLGSVRLLSSDQAKQYGIIDEIVGE